MLIHLVAFYVLDSVVLNLCIFVVFNVYTFGGAQELGEFSNLLKSHFFVSSC